MLVVVVSAALAARSRAGNRAARTARSSTIRRLRLARASAHVIEPSSRRSTGRADRIACVIARRGATAPATNRRAVCCCPVYAAGGATLVTLLLANVLEQLDARARSRSSARSSSSSSRPCRSRSCSGSCAAGSPAARSRGLMVVARARTSRSGPRSPTALGDPSLGLAFWLERERSAGSIARDAARPLARAGSGDHASSSTTAGGSGARSTTSRSTSEPELVESVAAAVAFALDNERLQTELRMQNERLPTVMRHGAEPARHGRHRRPASGRLNPATVERERLSTTPRRCEATLLLGRLHRPDEREAMMARFRAAAPEHRAGRVREHLHERPRRAAFDHLARRAGPGRVRAVESDRRRRARRDRAPPPGGGDPRVARPHRRGRRRGAPAARAEPARRRAAAARLALARAPARPGEARRPTRRDVAEILAGASEELALRARGAARARSRYPSGRAHRPRARRGARGRSPPARRSRSSSTPVGERLPEPIEAAAYYVVSEAVDQRRQARASATSVRGRGSRR